MPRLPHAVDQRLLACHASPTPPGRPPRRWWRSARPSRRGRKSPAATRRRPAGRAGARASSPRPGTPPDRRGAAPSDPPPRSAGPARFAPTRSAFAATGRRAQVAEPHALLPRRPGTSARSAPCRKIGRSHPACAQQRDQPLALAQRIAADDVRALRKQRDAREQSADFRLRRRMAEHRQREGRLGDEYIARRWARRRRRWDRARACSRR